MTNDAALDELVRQIRDCRICVDHPKGKPLPHEPRPVVVPSQTARILIAGQAPGTRVHASGIPFTDPSGDRLRAWLGVTAAQFYNPDLFAIAPMGFCFPGLDAHGGDLPPRKECAPAWRAAAGADAADQFGCRHRRLCPCLAFEIRAPFERHPSSFRVAVASGTGAQSLCLAAPFVAELRLAETQSVVRS